MSDKFEDISVSGMYAGIAAHLIKDSKLLSGGFQERIKVYVWLPKMSDNAHQAVFAANGISAGIAAIPSKILKS